MNRKDDHLKHAIESNINHNSFDDMILVHESLPQYNLDEIDISTTLANVKLSSPFFINAMTGGSEQAKQINQRLATIAKACDLMIASGSYSATIKDTTQKSSFSIIKETAPDVLLITNMGVDKPFSYLQQAISETNANFAQIHLNTLQELLMPEGDHNFKVWKENLSYALRNATIPIIVKEVGFGMSKNTIAQLINLGAKIIDISGKGGTNFAYIENMRNPQPITYLNDWGISTVISLLHSKAYQNECEFIASGGVRNALDIVKSLILGAKTVGLSQKFIQLLNKYTDNEIIEIVENMKLEIKKIMCLLNCKEINALKKVSFYFINDTYLQSIQTK